MLFGRREDAGLFEAAEKMQAVAFKWAKTAKGVCLMTDSPSQVTPRQLRDLHIEVKAAVKKE